MSLGDINDAIMPCERCDDLIAIGKGHVTRIERVGPNLSGVWYAHINESDCTPQTEPVQPARKGFGKPYVEVEIKDHDATNARYKAEQRRTPLSNVIQTEFTTLDVMLRRVRDANPDEIVVIYDLDGDDAIRVSWLGVDSRAKLVGMLTGAAMDIWNEPEKTVRDIGPGDSA